jgi:hypothetical protein
MLTPLRGFHPGVSPYRAIDYFLMMLSYHNRSSLLSTIAGPWEFRQFLPIQQPRLRAQILLIGRTCMSRYPRSGVSPRGVSRGSVLYPGTKGTLVRLGALCHDASRARHKARPAISLAVTLPKFCREGDLDFRFRREPPLGLDLSSHANVPASPLSFMRGFSRAHFIASSLFAIHPRAVAHRGLDCFRIRLVSVSSLGTFSFCIAVALPTYR